MTTTTDRAPHAEREATERGLIGPALILGGIAFAIGGMTHPTDSGRGNKVQQLHEMLIDRSWYPSHALLLVAMALFAFALHGLRRQRGLTPAVARLLQVAFVIACVATVSMTFHLFAATGADSLADGEHSLTSRVQTINETVVDAVWGFAIAAVALVGGSTRRVGNRITIVFGVLGGVAFALASATIAYTDALDPLFKMSSLVSVWAILVGVIHLRRSA